MTELSQSVRIIEGVKTAPNGRAKKVYSADCPRCDQRIGLKVAIKGCDQYSTRREKEEAERVLVFKAHRDPVCAAPCPAADKQPDDVVRWIAETRELLGLVREQVQRYEPDLRELAKS